MQESSGPTAGANCSSDGTLDWSYLSVISEEIYWDTCQQQQYICLLSLPHLQIGSQHGQSIQPVLFWFCARLAHNHSCPSSTYFSGKQML